MTADLPWRRFRYIEVLSEEDLKIRPGKWTLTDGWIQKAEAISPRATKGLVGGKGLVMLPSGVRFSEVSFKSEHGIVDVALPVWAAAAGRRWAKAEGDIFVVSDGSRWSRSELKISGYPKGEPDISTLPWLAKIAGKSTFKEK